MKISFSKVFRSIVSFESIELPNFVVLTGVNGAGKSHFLQALENSSLLIDDAAGDLNPNPPHMLPPLVNSTIRRFDWTNLVPADTGAFVSFQTKQHRAALWAQFSALVKPFSERIYHEISSYPFLNGLTVREIVLLRVSEIVSKGVDLTLAKTIAAEIKDTAEKLSAELKAVSAGHPMLGSVMHSFGESGSLPLIALDEDVSAVIWSTVC
jgi:hypothetical protein